MDQRVISRSIYALASLAVVGLLAYFAFHYARIAAFPIGDDPAIHIHNIQTLSYGQITGLPYPLPIALFKLIHSIAAVATPTLFIYLICTFLFVAALTLFLLVQQTFKSVGLATATAILFVTSRWVNDGLHMGLFAETFSWSILFLLLLAFLKRKLLWTVLLTAILVISHPFSTIIYLLFFLLYGLIVLCSANYQEERSFIIRLFVIYGALAAVVWLVKPEVITRFIAFEISDPEGWGNRDLISILGSDNLQRLYIPFMALLGLFASVRQWQKPEIRAMIILLTVALFFSLNYLFGVNFIPFRFYSYLEIALAFFAAYGLWTMVNLQLLPPLYSAIMTGIFALFLTMPNQMVNEQIGFWQANVPEAHATFTVEDRAAAEWIAANTKTDDSFLVIRKKAIWLTALTGREQMQMDDRHYSQEAILRSYTAGVPLGSNHIYFSDGHKAPEAVQAGYTEVYTNGPVSIWKVKP